MMLFQIHAPVFGFFEANWSYMVTGGGLAGGLLQFYLNFRAFRKKGPSGEEMENVRLTKENLQLRIQLVSMQMELNKMMHEKLLESGQVPEPVTNGLIIEPTMDDIMKVMDQKIADLSRRVVSSNEHLANERLKRIQSLKEEDIFLRLEISDQADPKFRRIHRRTLKSLERRLRFFQIIHFLVAISFAWLLFLSGKLWWSGFIILGTIVAVIAAWSLGRIVVRKLMKV